MTAEDTGKPLSVTGINRDCSDLVFFLMICVTLSTVSGAYAESGKNRALRFEHFWRLARMRAKLVVFMPGETTDHIA